jgi:formate dehydrogenase subunit gamma
MKTRYLALMLLHSSFLFGSKADSSVWGRDLLTHILEYDREGSLHMGHWFTVIQSTYVKPMLLFVLIVIPLAFIAHYLIVGPKRFNHSGKSIMMFPLFKRINHGIAAISFMIIVPTGIIMIFGNTFGGGTFVRLCKDAHAISAPLFFISVIPMLLTWFSRMLLSPKDDIRWLKIVGGYLSKEKKPIPAGMFNMGQKIYFWIVTLGGLVMIATSIALYFVDFEVIRPVLEHYSISQIDFLRFSALTHNIIGIVIVAMFMVHIYMSVFAIEGAYKSMIDGTMPEEEVRILHSSYYKELQEKGEV